MNTLVIHNDIHFLVDKLIEGLYQENEKSENIIRPLTVIVPNNAVRNWLSLRIAQKKGSCLNIQFLYVDNFIHRNFDKSKYSIISKEVFQRILLDILTENIDDYPEIQSYVSHSDSLERFKKLFQLSQELTNIYFEYFKFGQDMVDIWFDNGNQISGFLSRIHHEINNDKKSALFDKVFMWQMKLFQKVIKKINQSDNCLKKVFTPQLMHEHLKNSMSNLQSNPVFFFGITFLSELHLKYFSGMDNISLFLHYPLSDVPSTVNDASVQKWMKPVEELISWFNMNASHRWQIIMAQKEKIASVGLLGCLKNTLFERKNQIDVTLLEQNTSLDKNFLVLAAKSKKREIEAIADEICRILLINQNNTDFHLNDIAILSNNIDEYFSVIEDVFNSYHIPYQFVEGNILNSTRLVEGLENLLNLSTSDYTRSDILKIINHPNFIQRFGEDVNISEWERWIKTLGIYIGIDSEFNKNTAGLSYLDKDVFNWNQGFIRLLTGAFIENPVQGDNDFLNFYQPGTNEKYFPFDEYRLDYSEITGFLRIIQSLIHDTKALVVLEKDVDEWTRIITDLFTVYFQPLEKEELIYNRIISHISDLSGYHLPDETKTLPFSLVREIILSIINSIKLGAGSFPAGGVVITRYENIRPIPFDYTFLIGLEQDNFPTQKTESNLALTHYTHRILQNSRRELDCYHFIERLFLTEKSLFLSYTHRDIQKDRTVYPSILITEMLKLIPKHPRTIEDGVSSGNCFKEIPLKSYSGKYLDNENKDLQQFSETALYNSVFNKVNELSGLNHYYEMSEIETHLLEALKNNASGLLMKHLNLESKMAVNESLHSPLENSLQRRISISYLYRFLEDPLQESVKNALGIYDEDDDSFNIIHEPINTNSIDRSYILKKVFVKTFSNGENSSWESWIDRAKSLLEEEYDLFVLQGKIPTSLFSRPVYLQFLNILKNWLFYGMEIQKKYGIELSRLTEGWVFGKSGESRSKLIRFPAMLHENNMQWIISGKTEMITDNAVISLCTGSFKKNELRYLYRIFITLSFLSAYYKKNKDVLSEEEKQLYQKALFKDDVFYVHMIAIFQDDFILITLQGEETFNELVEYFDLLLSEIQSKDIHDYLLDIEGISKIAFPLDISANNFTDLRKAIYSHDIFKKEIIETINERAFKLAEEEEPESEFSETKYKTFKDLSKYQPPEQKDAVSYFVNRYALLLKYKTSALNNGGEDE